MHAYDKDWVQDCTHMPIARRTSMQTYSTSHTTTARPPSSELSMLPVHLCTSPTSSSVMSSLSAALLLNSGSSKQHISLHWVWRGGSATAVWLQVVMWQSCDYRLSCDSHVTAGFATLITMFPQVLWGIWSTITLVSCWQAANSSFSSSASETESCNKPEHIEMLNGFYCAIIVCWRN